MKNSHEGAHGMGVGKKGKGYRSSLSLKSMSLTQVRHSDSWWWRQSLCL